MKKIFVFFVLLAVSALGFFLYYREGTLPVNRYESSSKIFVIAKGEGLSSIANRLAQERLIRNKVIFYLVVKQLGIEKKIQAGDFRLSPAMNAYAIAKILTHGTLDVWITVIEGMRKEEVAQIVSKNVDIPQSELLKYAKEGYMFPDTYLVPKEATAESVIQILMNNLFRRYDERLRAKAARMGLTEQAVMIIASLVEREARFDEDRQEVASIILKRYRNDWPLQIDATIQYALGYQSGERSWWKKTLTKEDLELDSPFNTYKNKGLPPGPISNPGLSSIEAVVNADEKTLYWYYLSDKTGKMHYAKTLEEHNVNIRRYLE